MTPLLRAADALMTVLAVMIAAFGAVVAIATGHGLALLFALAAVWAVWRALRRKAP